MKLVGVEEAFTDLFLFDTARNATADDAHLRKALPRGDGYVPMDYVHALRIEEAKQLIETESARVEEISLKVGYDDPAFFRRLFKRMAGLTPAAYRRKFNGILNVGKGAAVTGPATSRTPTVR